MSWGFSTDPEFQKELDWIKEFVAEEVAPLELVLEDTYDVQNPNFIKLVRPLQQRVKDRGLWACHLGPELGGPGFGQLKLALMNEILGTAAFASIVFGCQAPDSGNAEILAHYGTEYHKEKWLRPLLDGEIVSCFSMTEPQGGADPTQFTCAATQDGDEWVINGEKWFSSNAKQASFLIVMAVTRKKPLESTSCATPGSVRSRWARAAMRIFAMKMSVCRQRICLVSVGRRSSLRKPASVAVGFIMLCAPLASCIRHWT
jgi:acyl-CoA dehydrogenase